MGIELARREADVRIVRCDGRRPSDGMQCTAETAQFLPDVGEELGGPVLLDATWLRLCRGISQWFFCSPGHLGDWVTGAGVKVLTPDVGVQPLGTKITGSAT